MADSTIVHFGDMAFGVDYDNVDYEAFIAPKQTRLTTKEVTDMLPENYLRDIQERARINMQIANTYHARCVSTAISLDDC
jgi:hypothetical protein